MKKLIATVYIKDGIVYSDKECTVVFTSPDGMSAAAYYSNTGMDALCLLEFSTTDGEHDKNIECMKEFIRDAEIPVYAGGLVKRFEDIKKYLYTGADKAVFIQNDATWDNALAEASSRFGAKKLIYCLKEGLGGKTDASAIKAYEEVKELVGMLYLSADSDEIIEKAEEATGLPLIAEYRGELASGALKLLGRKGVSFVSGALIDRFDFDAMAFKYLCKAEGMDINLVTAKLSWSDFKLNSDGLIPVIVQDYRTNEVLMLAYMNEEAFQKTVETGRMTYYSRSRQELWVKGLTSGHFQYAKSLSADCDFDTLLAKVSQVGAACHTGAYSCFFNEIFEKEYTVTNPVKVLEKEYATIVDRKLHPKEGSYTNYLFDKGLDKILKKVGEEAAEIIIAAKNPEPEEIKYEMADFLYHAMVMMVERGVTWEDITRELANR